MNDWILAGAVNARYRISGLVRGKEQLPEEEKIQRTGKREEKINAEPTETRKSLSRAERKIGVLVAPICKNCWKNKNF